MGGARHRSVDPVKIVGMKCSKVWRKKMIANPRIVEMEDALVARIQRFNRREDKLDLAALHVTVLLLAFSQGKLPPETDIVLKQLVSLFVSPAEMEHIKDKLNFYVEIIGKDLKDAKK
jgi:hypothetical protein